MRPRSNNEQENVTALLARARATPSVAASCATSQKLVDGIKSFDAPSHGRERSPIPANRAVPEALGPKQIAVERYTPMSHRALV